MVSRFAIISTAPQITCEFWIKNKSFFTGLGPSFEDKYTGDDLYINSLLKLIDKSKDHDISQLLHGQNDDEPPKSAIFYYLSVSIMLQDSELDELIKYLLREKCCKNMNSVLDDDDCMDSPQEKRNNIKKVKFHSWGGKRSGSAGNGDSGGRVSNSDLGKDGGQAKVVIRTPFRPWGGKRLLPHASSNTFFDVIR